MSFPEFNDIGKTAKDLLEKDFNLGKTKLEAKTTSSQGVEFTTSFERTNSDFIKGELKTKYKYSDNFTFTDTVNTDTDLSLKIEANNFLEGAKFDVDTLFNPNNGKRELKTGFNYKLKDAITSTGNFNVFKNTAKFDAVIGYNKFLAGAQFNFPLQNIPKADIGLVVGYVDSDYALTLITELGDKTRQFSVRYHHNINKDVTVALKASYPNKDNRVSLEFGTQYKLDTDASLKGKVSTNGKVDFAYTQKITKDLKASVGLSVDTQKLDSTPHQYGFGLTFEPDRKSVV